VGEEGGADGVDSGGRGGEGREEAWKWEGKGRGENDPQSRGWGGRQVRGCCQAPREGWGAGGEVHVGWGGEVAEWGRSGEEGEGEGGRKWKIPNLPL
jgi:hypothetical protein